MQVKVLRVGNHSDISTVLMTLVTSDSNAWKGGRDDAVEVSPRVDTCLGLSIIYRTPHTNEQ